MKHRFCVRRRILEREVHAPKREELDQYGLEWPLFHLRILDVSKLVIPARGGGENPHTEDRAIAYEMWWYQVTAYQGLFRHRVNSHAFRAVSGGEKHDTSQTPTSQLGVVPRSIGRDNFTMKSACLMFS